MLEGVWKDPQLLVEKDSPLAKLLGSGGSSTKVSEHTYRVTFQNALPGVRGAAYLDGSANMLSPVRRYGQTASCSPLCGIFLSAGRSWQN